MVTPICTHAFLERGRRLKPTVLIETAACEPTNFWFSMFCTTAIEST